MKSCVKKLKRCSSKLAIGTGDDVTIHELAESIAKVVTFTGKIIVDASKPDGTPCKLLDVSRSASLGWKASTSLQEGNKLTYHDFQKTIQS